MRSYATGQPAGGWLVAGGGVWPVGVVVDVPLGHSLSAVVFRGPGAGVEQFLSEGPLVAPRLRVMARGERPDPLMASDVTGGAGRARSSGTQLEYR
jgi:hypothetical protein